MTEAALRSLTTSWSERLPDSSTSTTTRTGWVARSLPAAFEAAVLGSVLGSAWPLAGTAVPARTMPTATAPPIRRATRAGGSHACRPPTPDCFTANGHSPRVVVHSEYRSYRNARQFPDPSESRTSAWPAVYLKRLPHWRHPLTPWTPGTAVTTQPTDNDLPIAE